MKHPPTTEPITVERDDRDDGAIAYEIWDSNPNTMHRIAVLDDEDNRYAKNDAELIARAMNALLVHASNLKQTTT